ncbi:MAG: (Fe-S)-binding protein [Betaproteobacteria bacterium]|nr:(Fe-S)-binding protein [Betaproteobacteria bacterium]
MPRQPMPTGAMQEFIRKEAERILAACTKCGKCFEACPMTRYSPQLTGAKPESVVTGILELLRREQGTPEALAWTSACVRSGSCVPACPDDVNPKMMVRIARMVAAGGLGGAPRIPIRDDRDYFDRIRAFARLQLTEEELKDWM